MKRVLYVLICAVTTAAMISCEGTAGNGENTNPTGAYTLVADKTVIEADGEDIVTFRLYSPDGEDLTASSQRNYITIEEINTGVELGSDFTFNTITNGTFRFKAYYRNYESENEVEVQGQNRSKYEKYAKKIAVYDLTNVMCGPCAILASTFESLSDDWQNRFCLMGIHTRMSGWDDSFVIDAGASLFREYGATGTPHTIFSLAESRTGTMAASDIVETLEAQLRNYPSTCGVAVKSASYDAASNSITISAGITSVTDGEYDLIYALLSDNREHLIYGDDYQVFNDVVYALTPNYSGILDIPEYPSVTLVADQEHTETHTFEFGSTAVSDDVLENTRVAVLAIRPNGDDYIIDNMAVCPLGESIDYVLNE